MITRGQEGEEGEETDVRCAEIQLGGGECGLEFHSAARRLVIKTLLSISPKEILDFEQSQYQDMVLSVLMTWICSPHIPHMNLSIILYPTYRYSYYVPVANTGKVEKDPKLALPRTPEMLCGLRSNRTQPPVFFLYS